MRQIGGLLITVMVMFVLAACSTAKNLVQEVDTEVLTIQSPQIINAENTTTPSTTLSPTKLPTQTPFPTSTNTWTPKHTPTPTPKIDPWEAYTIDGLSRRSYGGSTLNPEEVLAVNSYFTRTMISYQSDELTIYGFMNEPRGEGPFPVIIASHGYINPDIYQTLDYTTGYADALARAGYIVLHPNLRGYPPSDDGDNLFRVGMSIDVLNLISIVKQQAGIKGSLLEKANPELIGLWGHSMGGGISTRVMTVSDDIKAVVLYAAMSGDENQNFEAIYSWSDGERGIEELNVPDEQLLRISPIYFLDRIQAAVSIHHGRADELVPLSWSENLCDELTNMRKTVECVTYKGQPHTFYGEGEQQFIQNIINFYDQYLR